MTYAKFKDELYLELMKRKEIAGKQIRYWKADWKDILCVIWEKRGEWKVLHWNMETLYRHFCLEGMQSVISELIFRILLCERTQNKGRIMDTGAGTEQKLIMYPMNYKIHQGQLQNAIFWKFGDIALSLHILLQEGKEEWHAMQMDREQVERQSMSGNLLLLEALIRSSVVFPPRLYHGSDIRHYEAETAGIFMPEEQGATLPIYNEDSAVGRQGYRLTVAGGRFGAIALFYPGVKARLAELLKGDFYVGFLNVHEAVIHPVRNKALGEMRNALMRIHAVTDEREFLTRKIYRYREDCEMLVEV